MMRSFSQVEPKRRTGFSLTESAIVLGVVGLVLAAIWATASVVRARQPILDTVQIVTEIAGNVRGVYSGFPNAVPPLTVDDQVDAGLFPESVVNAARDNTINAWGGTLFLNFNNPVGNGFSIEIVLPASMDRVARLDACLGLITRLPATATNYAGGFTGSLPSATVEIDPTQGLAPSLAFARDGGTWENVTVSNLNDVVSNTTDCEGVAFYFKL